MRMQWDGEYYEVSHLRLLPSYIKVGDYITYRGDVRKVITVQKDVPRFSNLRYLYIHFTLQGRDGTIIPADDIKGRQDVFKIKKQWRKVPA